MPEKISAEVRERVERYILEDLRKRKSGYISMKSIMKLLEAKRIKLKRSTVERICRKIAEEYGLEFRAGLCIPGYKRRARDTIRLNLEEKMNIYLKIKEYVKENILVTIEEAAKIAGYSVPYTVELIRVMSRYDPEGDRILVGRARTLRGDMGYILYYSPMEPLIKPVIPGKYPYSPEGLLRFLEDRGGEADIYEIAAALGVSVQYTRRILNMMAKSGKIEYEKRKGVAHLGRDKFTPPQIEV
jgi:AraC-like DNA-binding protein